jgi:uncharacterized protein
MSESENVKIVQDAYAAFGRGDIPSLLASLSDDVVWTLPGAPLIPQAGTYRGPEGVAQFFQKLAQTTEFLAFEPREFVAQGDRVIALGSYQAKGIATGRSFAADWAMSFTIRDGKVVKFQEFTDTASIAPIYASSVGASA